MINFLNGKTVIRFIVFVIFSVFIIEIVFLQDRIKECKTDKEFLLKKQLELNKTIADLQSKIELQNETIKQLNNELYKKQNELQAISKQYNDKIKTLKTQLQNHIKTIRDLKGSLHKAEEANKFLEEQLWSKE